MFWIHTKACSVCLESVTYNVKYNKMTLQCCFWRKMTYFQVIGPSTCTHILVLFPFWWICQRMVMYFLQALVCGGSASNSSLWQVSQCSRLTFLIPVYPYNSLHQAAHVTIHTRNLLEKRFRLHPGKEASIFLPIFLPLSDARANIAFPCPCLLCSQTTCLIKVEIFCWSNCKYRHVYSALFWCRLTRVKAALGLPGREENPREVTLCGAAQASFA